MEINLLVVTPASSVADAIRRNLDEAGDHILHVVNDKDAALVIAGETRCSFAVLDLGLGEEAVGGIGAALRAVRPQIELLVLCEDGNPPALDAIRPWTLLSRPFQLTELLKELQNEHIKPGESDTDMEIESVPWLQDVAKAAQHLTRLTLESSAQAALITRNNELWAYAGGLSQNAGKEIAQAVARNWDADKGSDLLRFIRLESTRLEHMLYATRLGPDAILAMVFEAETPFSTIRMQANDLVSAISTERPAPPPAVSRETVKDDGIASSGEERPPRNDMQVEEEDEDEDELVYPSISEILVNVPSPKPPAVMRNAATEAVLPPQRSDPRLDETRASTPLSNVRSFPLRDLFMSKPKENPDELDLTMPSKGKARPETPLPKRGTEELAETRLSPTTEAERKITLEPVSAGLYHLTYACLLVPRFVSHYLTGDLADRLSEWLPTICIAFGWRLEYLAVRPEYLQWIVNVQPNTSPGYLMRVMRQQTSEKIFKEMPRMRKENPSGDFWAPGYLIMGGSQPHPPQLVRDYIKQARERQGLLHPRK
jgi:REP element-mobilizing transposase RayT/ActR/RegA family two-component response regulator